MFRSFHREINLLHKFLDLFIILISWALAYWLRFKSMSPEHLWYAKYTVLLVLFQYYFFRKFDLYSSRRLNSIPQELMATVKAMVAVVIFFVLSIYFLSPEKISRIVLVNFSVISTSLIVLNKLLVRLFLRSQRAQGKNLRYVVLVGDGKQLEDYVQVIAANPELGLKIRAWIDSGELATKYKIPSELECSTALIRHHHPDYIVIGYAYKNYGKIESVIQTCSQELSQITVLPDLSYALIGHEIIDFSGIPAININQPKLSSKSIIIKRLFDFVLSGLALVILSPILAVIGIGVKLSSPGPILFGQRRVGLDGKDFLMWKFRSMRVDAEKNGAGWTTKDDPRRTKFGNFIRKTSLDELPQLWNVFIGEMSLVGPRPEQPYFVEKFRDEIPAYMLRHKMKAGITGWAQINGWRGDTSIASRIECDIWYIRNWSIWLDLSIIIQTIWKGIFNKNAY